MQDLAFFSFEHYPYEPCTISWSSLYDEPTLVSHILQVWRDDGLPPDVPMFITESNITWNSGESSVDIFGALWLADYIGAFFNAGGKAVYYFHYLPLGSSSRLQQFRGHVRHVHHRRRTTTFEKPTSQFFASQLINTEWVEPGNGVQKVFAASGRHLRPGRALAGHRLRSAASRWAVVADGGQSRSGERPQSAHRIRRIRRRQHQFFRGPVSDNHIWQRAVQVASDELGRLPRS